MGVHVDTASHSISPSELSSLLGRPGQPLLLDVRRPERFSESAWLLPGALHCAPADVAAFARSQAPGEVIVYCEHGHELSLDAVRVLREAGWNARFLRGGISGPEPGVDDEASVAAWQAAPPLRMRKRLDLGVTGERPSTWITRDQPKIDRIACPWLVLRFIDPRARLHYVPAGTVSEQAKRLEAVAYDMPGAPITHAGEDCSFDALLAAFELRDRALDRLARIVRGADTERPGLAPQSAGLLAISLGLSALNTDDHAMLQAALPVYDALYAWCRSQGAAR
jgi:rhodanese-related sulfurtransferase